MENEPFEDVFPIKNGIFHCYVSLPEGRANQPLPRTAMATNQFLRLGKFLAVTPDGHLGPMTSSQVR